MINKIRIKNKDQKKNQKKKNKDQKVLFKKYKIGTKGLTKCAFSYKLKTQFILLFSLFLLLFIVYCIFLYYL